MNRPIALYYDVLCYQPENLELLEEHFEVRRLHAPSEDSPRHLGDVALCFAPLGYRFDAGKIAACPNLRVIATNTTGVPHIDMKAAAANGVVVCSLKDEQDFLETITPTAEHSWGLLLALTRRTPWAHTAVLEGRWDRRPFGAPAMLSRLRLGIVGYGRLGRMVARYGRAFRMPVRFHDPSVPQGDEVAGKAEALHDLFAWADVVSLHLPAVEATHKLIGRDVLEQLKPGSWLINTARGEVLDEDALLEMLRDGRLAGAALDVVDGEFVPGFDVSKHPLVQYASTHENLLLTPHIGGSTRDAWRETERRVIEMAVAEFG